MLHAITRKKAHCTTQGNEDPLTSSVFGQLLYLPVELMWEILRRASYSTCLPQTCGKIDFYEFWPKWGNEGTGNARFVEPDLFIRFAELDLLIEAKRGDERGQRRSQWMAEIRAYQNEYPDASRRLYFMALGGLSNEASERIAVGSFEQEVVKCRWSRILAASKEALHQLERCNYATATQNAQIRVLEDLITYFALHGYAIGAWLEEIDLTGWRTPAPADARVLRFTTHA